MYADIRVCLQRDVLRCVARLNGLEGVLLGGKAHSLIDSIGWISHVEYTPLDPVAPYHPLPTLPHFFLLSVNGSRLHRYMLSLSE